MKKQITTTIQSFVAEYHQTNNCETVWGKPIVGFAAADDTLFSELKHIVIASHALPADLLPEARTVIAFFIPFARSITTSNIKHPISSPEWATGYIETNKLIGALNDHLEQMLQKDGYRSATISATHNWIEEKLISNWSHRHVAYIAGLGRFGLNNMLITDRGCSGRVGSIITSAIIEPDVRPEHEACLFKYDGSCKKCVRKCVNEALVESSFDRFKCYEMLLKNVEEHRRRGYADVCGKCLAAVPCSHADPVQKKRSAAERKMKSRPHPEAD